VVSFFLILPVTPKENRKQSEKDWNMIFYFMFVVSRNTAIKWMVSKNKTSASHNKITANNTATCG
jgi:hypothetical protein